MQTLSFQKFFVATAIAAVTMAGQGAANAQVQIAGTTEGVFGAGAFAPTATFQGVTFLGGAFSDTTIGAFPLGIGGFAPGTTPGTPAANTNNLGSFTVSTAPFTYNNNPFTLRLSFTAPGTNSTTLSTTLAGAVNSIGQGGVFFDFEDVEKSFNYSTATTTGTVFFRVNDVSVNAGQTGAISGVFRATANPIPEMSTMVGMGSLLAGGGFTLFGGVIRRRRKGAIAA